MFVNKYTLNSINFTGDTSANINLPIGDNIGMLGQQDVVDRDFVDIEVDKAINIIFDYEKVKILPKRGNVLTEEIDYTFNLLSEGLTIESAGIANIGSTQMIVLKTSGPHNLRDLGKDKVFLSKMPDDLYNKEYVVERLGKDDGSGKSNYFVINLDPTTVPIGSAFITLNTASGSPSGTVKKLSSNWYDIGFNDDDLKFKKLAFTNSFLRLEFFDSDIVTNQNLISFITLYPKFSYNDVKDPLNPKKGKIPLAVNYTTNFTLGNPLIDRTLNGEGFSLYHFKDEIMPKVLGTPPKYLYMRANFNNAKTGKSTGLMSSNNPNLAIDELIQTTAEKHTTNTSIKNNLYTRYVLTRDDDGYYYEIDNIYSNNVTYSTSTNKYIIQLYEITAK